MPDIINHITRFLLILAGVWIVWHIVEWGVRTLAFSPEMFHEFITQGHPTLVYFHGRNCELCKHTRRAVLFTMTKMDDVQLLLINTSSGSGVEIAHEYGVREIPTCVIFDGRGIPTWDVTGLPDVDEMIAQLNRVKTKS